LFVGMAFRSAWQYRISLVLLTLAEALATALDFAAIGVVFAHVAHLRGFALAEVAFLYSTSAAAFAVAECVLGQLDRIGWQVRDGRMDAVLIRPVSPLVQAATSEFSPQRVGRLVQPTVVLAMSAAALDIHWTAGRTALVPLMIVCGALIAGSLITAGSALLFVAPDASLAVGATRQGAGLVTQYPMTIYSRHLMILMTCVVPVGFVNWQPALYILSRPDPLGLPAAARFLAPAVAMVSVAGAAWAWRSGIRHYRSTGS
jgi:ABC-2 type transport system permease protein